MAEIKYEPREEVFAESMVLVPFEIKERINQGKSTDWAQLLKKESNQRPTFDKQI